MVKVFNVSVNTHGIISPSKEWDFQTKQNPAVYSIPEMHLR